MNASTRCGSWPQAGASMPVARRVALLLADDRLAGVRLRTHGSGYSVHFRGYTSTSSDLSAVMSELMRLMEAQS